MNLEDIYRLLRSEHVQAQGIIDTVQSPLLVLDQDCCILSASRSFFETFKVNRDETIGQSLFKLGNGQWDIAELRLLLRDVVPKSVVVEGYEVEHDFPGLGRRRMILSARRLFHPDNNSTTLLLSMEDATTRLQKEEERELLLGELRHRVKNLLGVVLALARQTEAAGRTGEEYRDAFLGRFEALVQAHTLTSAEDGDGDLHGLVSASLRPYAADPTMITVMPGLAVTLAPAQILPLALILHELATNAIKYGALSAPQGRVEVDWEIDPDQPRLSLRWRELGGPTVKPPARRGFGSRLIEFAATRELGGAAELTFASNGLSSTVEIPLSQDWTRRV
jgi:two-component sensor histidine kinase